MFSATAAAAVHAPAVGLMRTISRASAVYPTDDGGSDVAVLRSACLCVRTSVRLRAHARSVSRCCETQRQARAEGITNMSNNMSDRTDLNVRHRAQPSARHVVQPSAAESNSDEEGMMRK